MYLRHFGLRQEPFSIAPDPRFLFMSERHREALAHLLYGLRSGGGFVVLTGEIGAGKTTVCRAFLEQVPPECQVAYVFNPQLTADELLQTVCQEFGIEPAQNGSSGRKACVDALNRRLLAAFAEGRHCVLVVDEAQALAAEVLEQLRLLTNLETHERKLLQIILVGQPELRALLARPELEQLAQRVIARYHLGPLDAADCERYVAHRLAVAGLEGPTPFTRAALRALQQHTQGVPRRINVLADRALLGAYAAGVHRIGTAIVRQAAREVFDRRERAQRWLPLAVAGLCSAGAVAGLGWWWLQRGAGPAAARMAAAASEAPVVAAAAASAASAASATSAAPAPPTPPAPEPPPPLLASAERPALADAPQALLLTLARRWTDTPPQPLCGNDRRAALQCLRSSRLTLATLATLDRPGLVTLQLADAPPWSALLLALDDQSVTVHYGGADHRLSRIAFGAAWRGDFTTFWRAPEGGLPASGAWLDTALQRALPGVRGPVEARVMAFQRTQGLAADGDPGALTLMQLNRVLAVDEPRLAAPR